MHLLDMDNYSILIIAGSMILTVCQVVYMAKKHRKELDKKKANSKV